MEAAGQGWQAGVQLGQETLTVCPVKRKGGSVFLRKGLLVALAWTRFCTLLGGRFFWGVRGKPKDLLSSLWHPGKRGAW